MIGVALCVLFLASASAANLKDGRIVNGLQASPGQVPYQVGLDLRGPNGGYWCGGALISDSWILTAAHCTVEAFGGVATLGSTERHSAAQIIPLKRENMHTHQGYRHPVPINDIALIEIPPVKFSVLVAPIALATDPSNTFVNSVAYASGWGLTHDNSNVSPVLNYAPLRVVRNEDSAPYFPGLISNNNICVSTMEGRSTCQGDSGGPLVAKDRSGKIVLIGVTSFGSKAGCQAGYPACFSRVTAYLPWIQKTSHLVL